MFRFCSCVVISLLIKLEILCKDRFSFCVLIGGKICVVLLIRVMWFDISVLVVILESGKFCVVLVSLNWFNIECVCCFSFSFSFFVLSVSSCVVLFGVLM